EGRGRFFKSCTSCNKAFLQYRCTDCIHGPLWCKECIIQRHDQSPLHQIEMWNSLFFQKTSLHDLGLQVQLSHAVGRRSPTAEKGHVDFAVINSNGIYHVNIDFCQCHGILHRHQLLHIGWWLATPLQPQTCVTMAVLKHFHLLNLQGKVPDYSFFHALKFQTDNTGLSIPVGSSVRFFLFCSNRCLLRAARQTPQTPQ
ncbi:hypothetical protein PILCRDRAFT_65138, partial [Piloderma croceum F 1598]